MPRWTAVGLLVALSLVTAFAQVGRAPSTAFNHPAVLERFLARDDPSPEQYRALRHLEAHNDRFESDASMDVWTEADHVHGFRYHVIGEEGSEYIRNHVFRESLDAERKMWASGAPDHANLTRDNYVFEDRGEQAGLASLAVKARRKDILLIDGTIFLRPSDGELVRVEGRLSKSPSFWTRRVEIVRWFGRFAGVRMPVALDTVANVLIAGRSVFRMTYQYETVNNERVGSPKG